MLKIVEVKNRIQFEYLKRNDINAIDIGYKYINDQSNDTLCIRFYVNEKFKDLSDKHKIPKFIDGIPTDIIVGDFSKSSRIYDRNVRPDYSIYDPMVGGMMIQTPQDGLNSTGIFNKGTAGMIVKRCDTDVLALLTNYHVVDFNGGVSNRGVVHQPSMAKPDFGHYDEDRNKVGEIGKFTIDLFNNEIFIDAAIVDVVSDNRTILNEIIGIGEVAGIRSVSLASGDLNIHVAKYGSTTGLTSGFIDGFDIVTLMNYSGIGRFHTLGCLKIRPDEQYNGMFASDGDSGSVVVDDDNNVIGLLFSADEVTGCALVCPISEVFQALDITLPTASDFEVDLLG